jgi:Ca2+-binding RTX toxin-like protein
MNGDDQLVIDTLSSFAGTIDAKAGDDILLGGIKATSATLQGQSLVLQNNGQTVGTLNLGGSYTGDFFNVVPFGPASSEVQVRGPTFTVLDTTTGATTVSPGSDYTGPVAGLQHQYINVTTDSLNITATAPNVFISSGSGNDALNVSGVNGNNILDGGGGSNFLTGGKGNDTFYLDVRNPANTIFSTIAGFHSGDNATVFGVSLADFTVALFDNIGAPGFTGLAFAFSKAGQPTANLVIAGYSIADLSNGRLSQALGTTGGTPYLTIHAN